MQPMQDTARCRSMRIASAPDNVRARSRWAIGLPKVQERRQAPGCYPAPANAATSARAMSGPTLANWGFATGGFQL
jgi:hypothetical protein